MNTKQEYKNIRNISKDIYGEFSNVFLTPDEHQKLVLKFGASGADDRIAKLSTYVASKGKKYKSHYATILSWEQKNGGSVAKPKQKSCRGCGTTEWSRLDKNGLCGRCSEKRNGAMVRGDVGSLLSKIGEGVN